MIVLASCSCCEGYVIKCESCKKLSSECSSFNETETVIFARKKGFAVKYESVTKPGKWLCKDCHQASLVE